MDLAVYIVVKAMMGSKKEAKARSKMPSWPIFGNRADVQKWVVMLLFPREGRVQHTEAVGQL